MAKKNQNDQTNTRINNHNSSRKEAIVADSEYNGLMGVLPPVIRDYALLARFDRPIGWWLLFWPCAWGAALAGGALERWDLLLWFLLGAIVMRGAGCVFNDIVDRDLDAQVARTAARPIASGRIRVKAAFIWLMILACIGFVVLLQLNRTAQITAIASLALVAAYPFMKRITYWPQAWLGMVFSWGILVGWLAINPILQSYNVYPMAMLYLGSIAWVIGFDTIYAMQDREDDALIGIGSSALRLGEHIRIAVAILYILALALWGASLWMIRPNYLMFVALLPAALHLFWQVIHIRDDRALDIFRSNRLTGLLMFLAAFVVGQSA